MKKYLFILKMTLNESLQHISNIILGFISYILIIFVFLNLWNVIYSNPDSLIGGYSIKQMLWYLIVTEMLWYGTRDRALTDEISRDIKGGKIAYHMNKPYNYALFVLFKYIGDIAVKFILYAICAILLGIILVGGIEFNIINIPMILLVVILSILINAIIRITISMVSFWIEENKSFHLIYDKLILIIGTVIPIELFPLWLRPIIKYTPIYVITYGPAKLVVDYSNNIFLEILLIQVIYLIVSISLMFLVYRRGVKKLNVNGG